MRYFIVLAGNGLAYSFRSKRHLQRTCKSREASAAACLLYLPVTLATPPKTQDTHEHATDQAFLPFTAMPQPSTALLFHEVTLTRRLICYAREIQETPGLSRMHETKTAPFICAGKAGRGCCRGTKNSGIGDTRTDSSIQRQHRPNLKTGGGFPRECRTGRGKTQSLGPAYIRSWETRCARRLQRRR